MFWCFLAHLLSLKTISCAGVFLHTSCLWRQFRVQEHNKNKHLALNNGNQKWKSSSPLKPHFGNFKLYSLRNILNLVSRYNNFILFGKIYKLHLQLFKFQWPPRIYALWQCFRSSTWRLDTISPLAIAFLLNCFSSIMPSLYTG